LEGCRTTIVLYPHPISRTDELQVAMTIVGFGMSLVVRIGFEPMYSLEGRFTVCCH
jgi:hypothetical protein